MIENIIENLTDNFIAVLIIIAFLYMILIQAVIPEAMLVITTFVIKYFFDKREAK